MENEVEVRSDAKEIQVDCTTNDTVMRHEEESMNLSFLSNVKEDVNEHRDLKYFCQTCDLNFEDKTCFKKHEVRYHGEIEYNCDKCEKDFHLCNHKATHARPEHDDLPLAYFFDALKSTHSKIRMEYIDKAMFAIIAVICQIFG